MESRAVLKYVRMSARKVRLVADQIRPLSLEEALDVLNFSRKRAAGFVKKVLNSAIANAEHRGADIDELAIKAIYVDEGPTLKRWRARAKGRGVSILKRSCHITVELV